MLPNRLAAIAGFIEKGASVADVGTDHGYLPVYLAQTGLAGAIIASDIGAGPLNSARRSAAEHGVTDKITFVLAPGLTGICKDDADTVVIAGVGGETIAQILSDAPWTKKQGVKLILQPQTKADELYEWLHSHGYRVYDAAFTRDAGRYYVILLVGAHDAGDTSDSDLLALLSRKRDPLFVDYVSLQITKTRRVIEGMERSKIETGEYSRTKTKLERLCRLLEEAKGWLK